MITDQDIGELLQLPKRIGAKTPSVGYREVSGHRRCDLHLQAVSDEGATFIVFVRQSSKFIENFSIGLRYQTGDKMLGTITLVRYNGPHGEINRNADGHYNKPHIHRVTAAEIASGSMEPQESHREITTRYGTFEQALLVFFDDIAAPDSGQYFPELMQGRLFNGH